MFEKCLWKSNILIKDAGHLHLYLKCHSSTGVFKHFASKKQLPGQSVSGILVENGLKIKKSKLRQSFADIFQTFLKLLSMAIIKCSLLSWNFILQGKVLKENTTEPIVSLILITLVVNSLVN